MRVKTIQIWKPFGSVSDLLLLNFQNLSFYTYNSYSFFDNKSMKSEKKAEFFVKQTSPTEKEVTLNNKYTLKQDDPFFQIIEFVIPLMNEKNELQKKKYHDVFEISYFPTIQFTFGKCKMEDEKCMICLEEYVIKDVEKQTAMEYDDDILMLGCSHKYHKNCLVALIGQKKWAKCPICSTIFGHMTGDQPDGTMTVLEDNHTTCPGHPKGTITITYKIRSGERKGVRFQGTTRIAYLPNTPEGRQVLQLLKEAFDRKLIFTVGRSVTTGLDNQVVWNGIHHKTSVSGGAANFAYPDPTYLTRVKEELACKGILAKK